MGFMSGFGPAFNDAATMEHQAKLAKQQEMMQANLKLAALLLGGDEEQQAQGLALMADPSKPFKAGEQHPNTPHAKNIMQVLGSGGPAQTAMQGPSGMAGLTGKDGSPLVQAGIVGDQGMPSQGGPPQGAPPQAPPLPPQGPTPAAQTTNPPATQGGVIAPQAAAPVPAPPVGAGGPPPQQAPQPPPPPPPDAVMAAMAASQQTQLPRAPLNAGMQQARYLEELKRITEERHAGALRAGGEPEAAVATLGGREGATIIKEGMRGDLVRGQGEANRDLKRSEGALNREAHEAASKAKLALATSALQQNWAKHMDSIAVQRARLAKSGAGAGNKAELARLTKLQVQGEKAIDGATEGISGIENLRLQYKLYTDTPFGITTAYDKAQAWNRYAKAVSSEGSRMARAMTAMTLPGNRGANESRIKAMEKELASLYAATDPAEGNYRIDNIEHLIRTTEEQLRANIEQLAAHPPVAGAPILPSPRPKADLSNVAGGPGAPKTGGEGTPKIGDTKTFKSGKKGRWDGTGWVQIP